MSVFIATSLKDLTAKSLQSGVVTNLNFGDVSLNSVTRFTSLDGRYILFGSTIPGVISGKTTPHLDVFRQDLWNGDIVRASTGTDGAELPTNSVALSISGDGRYVAFTTSANGIVPNDFGGGEDIYRKDLVTGQVIRITETATGVQANSGTYGYNGVQMTPDGRYFSFYTDASNLAPDDTDGSMDLFWKDTTTGTVLRLAAPGVASESLHGGSMSDDGRYVLYDSPSSSIVAGDTNGASDIFRFDTMTGATQRISTTSTGAQANGASNSSQISADGRYVKFLSYATNLVAGDTNGVADWFVKDLTTGAVTLAKDAPAGAPAIFHYELIYNAPDSIWRDTKTNQSVVFHTEHQIGFTKLGPIYDTPHQVAMGSADGKLVTFATVSGHFALDLSPPDAALSAAAANILRTYAQGGENAGIAYTLSDKLQSGALTRAQAIQEIVKAASATTSVATLSYEFFTGKLPFDTGLDYLVAKNGSNVNNVSGPYYQSFSLENRYINFAVNLGKFGDGKTAFTAAYGTKSLFEATKSAYGTIFGKTPTDATVHSLLDPTFIVNGQTLTRADYFAFYGQDGANGIGTKAAMVGWLLSEAVKADIGMYAKANDAFLTDLADGATLGVDLIGVYGKPEYNYLG